MYPKWVLLVLGSLEGSSLVEEEQNLPCLLNTGSSVILRGRKMWTVYLVEKFLWQSDLALVQIELYTNSKKIACILPLVVLLVFQHWWQGASLLFYPKL